MIQFIIGLVVFIFGLMIMPIPIVGWFFGILLMLIGISLMLSGFIKILFGIFGGSSDDKKDNVIIKNEISTADELSKLSQLLKDGTLTKEEFDIQKQNILNKK